MAANKLSQKTPDGDTIWQTAASLGSFWCGTPSAQFTIVCLGATCVVASVITQWNTFVKQARTRGFTA